MIQVTKADGNYEPFSEKKVLASLKRTGIPEDLHKKVLSYLESKPYEKIPTSEIYDHVRKFLQKSPRPFATAKYSLKQGIMDLGPTGYPFEDYVARVLEKEGYTTQTRQIINGKCISHEIDVVAQKHTVLPTKMMVEAKFHNTLGIHTNVHVPMYTKSRFEDIKEKNGFTGVMLITNTKATRDAISYAECVGMKIISWSYPEGNSLRDLVEKYNLYPITTLETLPRVYKQKLLERAIVLCSELLKNQQTLDNLGIDKKTKEEVLKEASFLCNINNVTI